LFELLGRVAAQDPERTAVLTHDGSTTYAELALAARGVASALKRDDVDRFAVVDHEAETVIAILAGASLAGAEACLYPPAEPPEIGDLLARFDHDLIVTPRDDLSELGARVVTPNELGQPPEADASDAAPPEARPHLVLTTGTTGAPRGVRHDWNRLLRATDRIKPGAGERWLLAYGLHQFAGLQVLLHVLAAGATLVAPAPRRPVDGLAALRELGVTHASATPTYWRFLLAEMKSDGGPVPVLRQVTLGGEAIPGPLLDELERTFPDANISQVYAASEFGSTGSMRDRRPGLSTEVLDRADDADVAMKIVDGELWIRSRTGMLGYYGEEPIDADGWRATGDMVVVEGDRILFTGRSSDIINVGGVKVHPLPIEERVSAVPGVAMARVYGRPNAMTGAIVALEVVSSPDGDRETIEAAIRAACADLPAAARPRSIRFVDEITTAGHKIIRRDHGEP
jgi:acyl-CoA synthetase (AMP-forming)/AMP-acid ligase II